MLRSLPVHLALALIVTGPSRAETFDPSAFGRDVLPLVNEYCIDCHDSSLSEGDIDLEAFASVEDLWTERDVWHKVMKQLRARAMPPDRKPAPETQQRDQVVAWLEEALKFIPKDQPVDPGKVTVRRLNRREYDLTIRDLFGVELAASEEFPDDDVGYGFDNIGDVLTISPLRLELYLNAAETIAANLFYRPKTLPIDTRIEVMHFEAIPKSYNSTDRGRELGPDFVVQTPVSFPMAGEYEVSFLGWGVSNPRDLKGDELWLDEKDAGTWDPHGPKVSAATVHLNDAEVGYVELEEGNATLARQMKYSVKMTAPAGRHLLKIRHAFVKSMTPEQIAVHLENPQKAPRTGIRQVQIRGPFSPKDADLNPLHRALLSAKPETIKATLEDMLTRAYRRPATRKEIDSLHGFVQSRIDAGSSMDHALELAVQATLLSPHFLYRLEWLGAEAPKDLIAPLNDFAIASRLSYFIWSSMPDEELFQLAKAGQLSNPAVLEQQVQRMLDDPKSEEFANAFFGQWLELHKVIASQVDRDLFPQFGSEMMDLFRQETLLFVGHIVKENRPVLDLLTADYTFVNGTLARHYGIRGLDKKAPFQKVRLDGHPRRGLLTQGSVLLLTSYPNRTSPTRRGNWILSTILGDEPPPAPPNVPELESNDSIPEHLPLRERLELHRTNPTCVSCHETMDAIGFGFENFDVVGQWRTKDGKQKIDSSGSLPSGETFNDALALVDILSKQEKAFVSHVTSRLLTFALGRGVEYYDLPAIEQVVEKADTEGYRFRDIVTQVALSRPFLLQRMEDTSSAAAK